MPFCDHCGKEQNPFDKYGNEGWICPEECEDDIIIEKVRNEEAAKSDEQLAAEAEELMED